MAPWRSWLPWPLAVGATWAGSLFGALAAIAMSAGVGLATSLEVLEANAHHRWRLAAWAVLALGWAVLAAMLLNRPLQDPAGVRLLVSVLVIVGAVLRIGRCRAQGVRAAPVLAVAFGFAALALAATWSGVLLHVDTRMTAIGIGCALELFGAGSFWLGEAWAARDRQRAADEKADYLHRGANLQPL